MVAGVSERYGNDEVVRVNVSVGGGAYTANDAVGALQTIEGAARGYGNKAILLSLTIVEVLTTQAPALEIYFFDRSITAIANNAPFTPGVSDLTNCLGVVSVASSDWKTFSGVGAVATIGGSGGLPLMMRALDNNATIYAQVRCTGTPTLSVGGTMIFKYGFLRD